ncbi:MAG: putative signal peptide protein [Pseudomonadota bacterium]
MVLLAPSQATDRGAEAIRGVVRTLDQAAIATELTTQRVEDVRVRDGAPFKKGDVLLTFDCKRLEAEADVAKAQVREQQLAHDSSLALEKRQAIGRFDVEIAAARLARARAELSVHHARLLNCKIIAPFAGRVSELAIRAHEFPQPGRPLLTVVGTERIEIELLIPSRALDKIKPGHQFQFSIDELAAAFPARVDRVGASVDPVSQLVKIYAHFVELPRDVLPGMSGTASGLDGKR